MLNNERGFTTITIVALTLPLFLLLTTVIFDLSRVPIAQGYAFDAVTKAALRIDAEQTTDKFERAPVIAYNFCTETTLNPGSCDSAAVPNNFLKSSTELVNKACQLAATEIQNQAADIFSIPLSDLGIQFSVIEVNVNPANGAPSSASIVVTSDDDCAGTGSSMTFFNKFSDYFDTGDIVSHADWLRLGGWLVETDHAVNTVPSPPSFPVSGGVTEGPWLAGYYIVGIVHTQVTFYLPGLYPNSGLTGSCPGCKNRLVSGYVVKNLSAVSGIEKP